MIDPHPLASIGKGILPNALHVHVHVNVAKKTKQKRVDQDHLSMCKSARFDQHLDLDLDLYRVDGAACTC